MYKMNGRLEPASNIETAGLKNKDFKCIKCGDIISIKAVEFAEKIVCHMCGGTMQEIV